MTGKPYRDGEVHVLEDKCETCIFRPGNLMMLQPGRVKGMVEESIREDTAITCHSTLYGQTENEAVCRGFFDSYAAQTAPLRAAVAMGIVAYDPVPSKEDGPR